MIGVAVFLGLVFLCWGLLLAGAVLLIAQVNGCPACFHDTVRVQRPWLRLVAPWLEWRWCPSCRWQGPSRPAGSEVVPPPSTPS